MKTIDIHAHVIGEETMRLMQQEAPKVAPRITPIDGESAVFEVAGTPYRPFPRGGFDLARRFKDMAAAEVDMQAVSVCPQTFLYDQDASLVDALARIQNEQIAKLAKQHPDRFMGLATLPMQAPERAAEELRRAVRTLGLAGAMIGSNVAGRNLDDPALEPVWAAAAEVDAFMLIHPVKVAGADRLRAYYLTNLIGNPLDTTIAAACLAFAGVLERYPSLKICLSHGGGFTPYQAGRFAHGPLLLRHHFARRAAARIPDRLGRPVACAARQRLSVRHGHGGVRAPGARARHPRGRPRHHPGRPGRRHAARSVLARDRGAIAGCAR